MNGKKVSKLLIFVGGVVAFGVLLSALRGSRIGEIPFALAVTAIALVNLSRWSAPAKGITSIWLISAAALATDLLTMGRVGFLFWCACVPLAFFWPRRSDSLALAEELILSTGGIT